MTNTTIQTQIGVSQVVLETFLRDPSHLKHWTVHRDLYWMSGGCYEACALEGEWVFTEIRVSQIEGKQRGLSELTFSWWRDDKLVKQFVFEVSQQGENKTQISVTLPPNLSHDRLGTLNRLLALEFELLNHHLSGKNLKMSQADAEFLQIYHTEMST